MRLMVLLSCAFLLGWVLSWMYFVSWTDGDHSISIEQFQSAPDAAATSSQVDAETGFGLDETPAVTPTIAASVNLLAGVRSRLERGEFDAVMAEYPVLQGQLAEDDALRHRQLIVDHARSLKQSGWPDAAQALLGLYLQFEYRDVSALLLMAEIYQAINDPMEAIETLFQARSYAYEPALIEQIDRNIRSAVKIYNAQLRAVNDPIAQLNLYRRLTELEPEYTRHFIGLAEIYFSLGNLADARKTLELTRHDLTVQPQAEDILRRIDAQTDPERDYAAAIALKNFGNQFLVDARLNDRRNAVLLLDTGASLSIISTEMMSSLGVRPGSTDRVAWFSTAGGRIKAPIIRLERMALDGIVVDNIEVGVISEFDNGPIDGLLGMNFLRHFEFFIDQNASMLQVNVP